MDSRPSVTIRWKAVQQYFTVVLFVFNFTKFVILENLSILDLALSRVKELRKKKEKEKDEGNINWI